MGDTTADAPRPDFGTVENAIPSTVVQMVPKITKTKSRSHLIFESGRLSPNSQIPNRSNIPI